jgi:hypothetical protein
LDEFGVDDIGHDEFSGFISFQQEDDHTHIKQTIEKSYFICFDGFDIFVFDRE